MGNGGADVVSTCYDFIINCVLDASKKKKFEIILALYSILKFKVGKPVLSWSCMVSLSNCTQKGEKMESERERERERERKREEEGPCIKSGGE